jgi:hypothetical protein
MELNYKGARYGDNDGITYIPPTSYNIDLDPEIPSPDSRGKRPMGRDAAKKQLRNLPLPLRLIHLNLFQSCKTCLYKSFQYGKKKM